WDSKRLAEGDSFEQTLRLGGVSTKIEWTVVELQRPRRAVWSGLGPARSRARVVYALSERRGLTTFDYTNSFGFPGGAIGRLAGRVASASAGRSEAEESLAALKELLERGGAAEERRTSRGPIAAVRSRLVRLAALGRGG
ncbi:MAG: hypothetical protein M3O25_05050, partial [Actinomycetota bacterium]|nr:hypothetical protein [Actinomycetota bacterium]